MYHIHIPDMGRVAGALRLHGDSKLILKIDYIGRMIVSDSNYVFPFDIWYSIRGWWRTVYFVHQWYKAIPVILSRRLGIKFSVVTPLYCVGTRLGLYTEGNIISGTSYFFICFY